MKKKVLFKQKLNLLFGGEIRKFCHNKNKVSCLTNSQILSLDKFSQTFNSTFHKKTNFFNFTRKKLHKILDITQHEYRVIYFITRFSKSFVDRS